MSKTRNTNNSADDEFGFDYSMSEDEYNKRHRKALKKADSSYTQKKKKDVWVKLADGLYEKQKPPKV
jgi:Zn-finger nucleic acid-binding protein